MKTRILRRQNSFAQVLQHNIVMEINPATHTLVLDDLMVEKLVAVRLSLGGGKSTAVMS